MVVSLTEMETSSFGRLVDRETQEARFVKDSVSDTVERGHALTMSLVPYILP